MREVGIWIPELMINTHLDVSLALHANYQLAAQQENQKHSVHNQKSGTT